MIVEQGISSENYVECDFMGTKTVLDNCYKNYWGEFVMGWTCGVFSVRVVAHNPLHAEPVDL